MSDVTAPYSDRAEQAVRQTHRQKATAQLVSGVGDPLQVTLTNPIVTYAEDWAPAIQISADAIAPDDRDVLAGIDPRTPLQLQISAGYVYPDGVEDVQLLAAGQLRTRQATFPSNSMPITAWSAEGLAQDTRYLPASTIKAYAGLVEAVTSLAAYAIAPAVPVVKTSVPNGYRPDLTAAVLIEQGTSMWQSIELLAASAGMRVWVDEANVWRIEPRATIAGTTAVFLKQGPGSIATKAEDTLTREGWYNAAVITYTRKDAAGVEKTITGTWAPQPDAGQEVGAGCKAYFDERPGPVTQSQANEAARQAVWSLSTRGAAYVVDAVAAYWLRPGMTVQVELANGTTVRHIVRQVVFQLQTGTMTVTTREPSNLGEKAA